MTTHNISLTNTNLPTVLLHQSDILIIQTIKYMYLLVLVFIREINFDFEDNNATVPKAMK